ncbi:MAG: hypothetical protein QX189_15120 [Methylococcales bacterium]
MKHLTIKIHWYGPYFLDEVNEFDAGNGLYLLTGKRKYQREEEIQYCGITEKSFSNRFKNHHKIPEIVNDLNIWLGEVAYPSKPSRIHLETAEAIVIYFLQPSINERKKCKPPIPTTLISHWFKRNDEPRFNQLSIYKNLHDVLSWDGEYWRTGNLVVYSNE